jgi:hypothetical protein
MHNCSYGIRSTLEHTHFVDQFIPEMAALSDEFCSKIERLMNAFKGHRCALDFDHGFVHSELRNAKIDKRIIVVTIVIKGRQLQI